MTVQVTTTQRKFTITVSEREAAFLRTVLRRIRGENTEDGPRRYAQKLDGDIAVHGISAKVGDIPAETVEMPGTWTLFEALPDEGESR